MKDFAPPLDPQLPPSADAHGILPRGSTPAPEEAVCGERPVLQTRNPQVLSGEDCSGPKGVGG